MSVGSPSEQAWVAVQDVDGWMTRGQSDALFDAAAACPRGGAIVEIGSFRGRSIIVLALAAPSTTRIYAIDPHAGNDRGPQEIEGYEAQADDDHEVFKQNLAAAGVADRVTHLRKFSSDAVVDVTGQIDVLYIDGAHRYRPALADITTWGKKVSPGGTMLIHDSFSSLGVTAAIARHLVWNGEFEYLRRSRSLAVYRRRGRSASPCERLTNLAKQIVQFPWFIKNLVLKTLLSFGLGRVLHRLGRPVPEWPY